MSIERNFAKTEKFIHSVVESLNQTLWYKKQESVGTIRVLDSFADRKYYPGYDFVMLDFGVNVFDDDSAIIYKVPRGLIKPRSVVEIVVKRQKVKTTPESFLVGVRPFVKENYGKDFGKEDKFLNIQFGQNQKWSDSAVNFYKKFLTTRLRKEPPFRF